MRVTMWGRRVPAAGLLIVILLFFAGREEAAAVTNENGTEIVYQLGQRTPSVRNSRVRHVRRHHRRAGTQVSYSNGEISVSGDAPIAVPDSGSTLAMMAASAALLLLGYRRFQYRRIAA